MRKENNIAKEQTKGYITKKELGESASRNERTNEQTKKRKETKEHKRREIVGDNDV